MDVYLSQIQTGIYVCIIFPLDLYHVTDEQTDTNCIEALTCEWKLSNIRPNKDIVAHHFKTLCDQRWKTNVI